MTIRLAEAGDVSEILDLQAANQPDRGGALSAAFSEAWFRTAIGVMPVIVARRFRLVGYLVSSTLAAHDGVPVVQAMLAAYRGAADAYVYGPVCVAEEARGQGTARAMFDALRAELPGREGVLFIRSDNQASLRAHAKMGVRRAGEFDHGGAHYFVLSYIG
ncbi:MAG TPA: GNAT family N-acetyltransferase [Rhizobiaceae bacterium]